MMNHYLIHFKGYRGRAKTWRVIGADILGATLGLLNRYGFDVIRVVDLG